MTLRWHRQRVSGPPVLYGRDRERTLLAELLEEAIAGHGSPVLISGEAGIGKTTLVSWMIDQAHTQGMLVLSGGCYDLTTTPPYGPWTETLRGYRPDAGLPPVPDWFGSPEELEKVGSQVALFEETQRFFANVAENQPLAIILEDLHWADSASLEGLRYLSRTLRDAAILLVATYRDDEITRHHPLFKLLPALIRESGAERVELQGFDQAAISEFVSERYRLQSEEQDRLIAYLYDRSEGNPLFATELLRALEHEDVLSESRTGWRLGDLSEIDVPPLVVQMIEARLAHLDPGTRTALETAAIVGHDVPLDLWCEIGHMNDQALEAVLDEAFRANLIEESSDGLGVEFTHALVRETLYEGVILPRRRRCHLRVAEALVEAVSPDPNRVAHHFSQAGDARAVDWLIKAGDRAAKSYAWNVAVERFDAAQQLLSGHPERATERALLLVRAGYLNRYIDLEYSLSCLREAEKLARQTCDEPLIAHIREFQIYPRYFLEDLDVVMKEQEEILSTVEALTAEDFDASPSAKIAQDLPALLGSESGYPPPHPGIAVIRGGVIAAYAQFGQFTDALEDGYAHLNRLDRFGIPHSERSVYLVDSCRGIGIAEALLGYPDRALASFERAREAAADFGHTATVGLALLHILEYVLLTYRTDDRRSWHRVRSAAESALESSQFAFGEGDRQADRLHYLDYPFGNWEQIEQKAKGQAEHATQFWRNQDGYITLARIARARGNLEFAWRCLSEALPDGSSLEFQYGDVICRFDVQRLAVDLALDEGDLDTARQWLEAYDHWLDWSGAVLGQAERELLWARYHFVAGSVEQATSRASAALKRATEPRQPLALIATLRFLGQLALADGRHAEAADYLESSLELARVCETVYEQAQTMLLLTELHIAIDECDAAVALLVEIRSICNPLKATVVLQRVDELEGQLSSRIPMRQRNPAGLTPREVDVLHLVAQGMTDAEAAERLFLSPRTVSSYLSSVYNKLGVKSRTAAVSWAVREGLLD